MFVLYNVKYHNGEYYLTFLDDHENDGFIIRVKEDDYPDAKYDDHYFFNNEIVINKILKQYEW